MTLVTTHFSLEELACHDGTPYPAGWLGDRGLPLCETAEVIRMAWGEPLLVISAYRTPAWNTHVGGAGASQHVEGKALDLSPTHTAKETYSVRCARLGRLTLDLFNAGKLPHLGGLGVYTNWIHIDVRTRPPSGHLAQWLGTGVGSEVTG